MRNRIYALGAPILLATILLAGACSDSRDAPSQASNSTGEISGEVFIVTAGGPSIKLGLVTVAAIPEAEINAFIQQRRQIADALTKESSSALQASKDAVSSARAAVAAADRDVSTAAARAHEEYLRCLQTADTKEECVAGKPHYEKRAFDVLYARKKELAAREAELRAAAIDATLPNSSEFYFVDLPAGIASAKTNADGLFTLSIPRDGRYALAARASRQVLGESEEYYWLVWTSLEGAASKSVYLSNDNLTVSGSIESVIVAAQ